MSRWSHQRQAEVCALIQQRIRDLEGELTRLQAQNDELAANTRDEEFNRLQDREPALT